MHGQTGLMEPKGGKVARGWFGPAWLALGLWRQICLHQQVLGPPFAPRCCPYEQHRKKPKAHLTESQRKGTPTLWILTALAGAEAQKVQPNKNLGACDSSC